MKAWMCDGVQTINFDSVADAVKFAKEMCFLTGAEYWVGKHNSNKATYVITAGKEFISGRFNKVNVEKYIEP